MIHTYATNTVNTKVIKRGIVNWSDTRTTTDSITFFSLFQYICNSSNMQQKTDFTNNLGHLGFQFRKYFLKTFYA